MAVGGFGFSEIWVQPAYPVFIPFLNYAQSPVEVMLVDPRRIKNVPGRKTDVLDCQWLQQLHTYGLLSEPFGPTGRSRRLLS